MDSDLLYQVSNIDRELKKIEKDKKIKEMAVAIRRCRKEYEKHREEYDTLEKSIKRGDVQIDEAGKKLDEINREIKELESKLYTTSSMKTIDACQKSIETKNKEARQCEEELYSIMESTDEKKQRKSIILKEAQSIKEKYNELRAEYVDAQNVVNKMIEELNERRDMLMQEISEKARQEYEEIKKRRGIGMYELKGETCSGCGMDIPTAIINDARDKRKLTKCPNCGVLLYLIE